MAALHDDVLDNGIQEIIDKVENIYICSSDPVLDFTAASNTAKLGTKASPSLSGTNPQDGASNGRRVVFSAITDGTVNTAGTATHYAVTDDSASKVLASAALSASKDLATGSPWTLTEFSITIPDAT